MIPNGSGNTPDSSEIDALSRYGMRWAVLMSLKLDLCDKGVEIPSTIITELHMSRVMLESGCFPSCEIGCSLDKIEAVLISKAASFREECVDGWLALLEKAMTRKLVQEELNKLPFLKPIISECTFLKCGCGQNNGIS